MRLPKWIFITFSDVIIFEGSPLKKSIVPPTSLSKRVNAMGYYFY